MRLLKRLLGAGVVVFGAFLALGTAIGKDPLSTRIPLALFSLAILAAGVWLWRSAESGARRASALAEQQKLLALVSETGTLTAPRVIAALGLTKEEADAALTRLRQSGLAEFDLDESGTPVYRVSKEALAVQNRKAW